MKFLALAFCFFALPALAQNGDDLDYLVVSLEQDRVLAAAGLRPLPNGFVAHFFSRVAPSLRGPNPRFTSVQLEERLRKWNTGIFLLAVPAKKAQKLYNDKPLCIVSVRGQGSAPYWLYLAGNGPQAAIQQRNRFEIESAEKNLENLKDVGFLEICEGA